MKIYFEKPNVEGQEDLKKLDSQTRGKNESTELYGFNSAAQ